MDLVEYAMNELKIINYKNKDKIIKIIDIIRDQRHGKFSMEVIINAIKHNSFTVKSEMIKKDLLKELKNDFDEIKPFIQELNEDDIDIITKLLDYYPLSSLTLEDNEWYLDFGDIYKNKRLFYLFKDGKNGEIKFADGVICKDEKGVVINTEGVCVKETNTLYFLRSLKPKQFDEFPRIKIKVTEEEICFGDYITYTTEEELDKVRKYYDISSVIYEY